MLHPRTIGGLVIITLMLPTSAASGQALTAGAALPRLEAESLADTKVTLPEALAGRPAVIVFSFSRGAGSRAQDWTAALGRRFADGGPSIWSVASLQGAPRFVRGMIRGGMRKQAPAATHGRVLCLYTDDKLWRQRLGVTDADVPIVVAVDASGQVRWIHRGIHDAAAEQALGDVLLSK